MRIAQVAPLAEAVPPRLYGGTERVVHDLCEGLVAQGHEVTLFASGDSKTSAKLVPCAPEALRLAGVRDVSPWMSGLVREVLRRAQDGEFDLVHAHIDHWGFALSALANVPVLHTMHGRMDDPDHHPLYSRCEECVFVSISENQRTPVPGATWIATVHHGIPAERFAFAPRPEEPPYVLFLGRISKEKRPDLALDAARRAKVPIKIAAKVDAADRRYFETDVEPRLNHEGVEFLGEVDDAVKARLLQGASALVFPIDWPEPFGLVAIEALACGTPVVTRPFGAIPEIVENGKTGLFCLERDELADAIHEARKLDRAACRAAFEARFTVERMVAGYERIYSALVSERAVATERPTIRLAA